MPIGGVVITIRPEDMETARTQLAGLAGVEIHGADEHGHIVAVLDTRSEGEMERLIQAINKCPAVLHVGLTYLNMEDVVAANALTFPGGSGAGE